MLSGKTKSGFVFQVDENKFRSKRFVKLALKLNKAAKDAQSGEDTSTIVWIQDEYELFVLGEEQQEKLIAHCDAKAGGYAAAEDVQREVNEIISIVAEKNSAIKNS